MTEKENSEPRKLKNTNWQVEISKDLIYNENDPFAKQMAEALMVEIHNEVIKDLTKIQ